MNRILIIQTAFIGDVILATPIIEVLKKVYPEAKVDFLLRKGNEELLHENPKINDVIVWDKKRKKYSNLLKIIWKVRWYRYDLIINVHRFGTSGLITWLSGAKIKIGFDKNPFSFSYNHKLTHEIKKGVHEVDRNLKLLEPLGINEYHKPALYPSLADQRHISELVKDRYVTMAPASVWFTKQFPVSKWVELVNKIPKDIKVCLLGGGNDINYCEEIIELSDREELINMAGKLNFLESAALMRGAEMNYVNDSAPMHMASAVNAPVTAIFCSTIPDFGFGPLSDNSSIMQIEGELDCRPCGLHGLSSCPKGHFKCALDIEIPNQLS